MFKIKLHERESAFIRVPVGLSRKEKLEQISQSSGVSVAGIISQMIGHCLDEMGKRALRHERPQNNL